MNPDTYLGAIKEYVTLTSDKCGEVYSGEVDTANKRCGRGVLKWPNGNCYFGEWRDGCMSGTGTFTYAVEGDKYTGGFQDDKKCGKGRYEFGNGNFYDGEFLSDKRHGAGKYSWTCGDSYDGEWSDGHMHGKGTTVYSNGNKYVGDFCSDRREGNGVLICADGLKYDGAWQRNMRHGKGSLIFPSGDSYEGEWSNDKKHGFGVDTFGPGNRFEGNYANNVKSGQGVMSYGNGDRYVGEWLDDKMHGQGKYSFTSGFVYEGGWMNNTRHGRGVYNFANGNRYDGHWAEDKRHGKGCLTSEGVAYDGAWEKGKMCGLFTVNYLDGTTFKGQYSKGVVSTGSFNFAGGPKVRGQFVRGEGVIPNEEPVPQVEVHPHLVMQSCRILGSVSLASTTSANQPKSVFESLIDEGERRVVEAYDRVCSEVSQLPAEVDTSVNVSTLEGLKAQLAELEVLVAARDSGTDSSKKVNLSDLEAKVSSLKLDVKKQKGLVEMYKKATAKSRVLQERLASTEAELAAFIDDDTVFSKTAPTYEGGATLKGLQQELDLVKKRISDAKSSMKTVDARRPQMVSVSTLAEQEKLTQVEVESAAHAKEVYEAQLQDVGLQLEELSIRNAELATIRSQCRDAEDALRCVKKPAYVDGQLHKDTLRVLQDQRQVLESEREGLQNEIRELSNPSSKQDVELLNAESTLVQAEEQLEIMKATLQKSTMVGKMRRKSSSLLSRNITDVASRSKLESDIRQRQESINIMERQLTKLKSRDPTTSYTLSENVGREVSFNQLIKERSTNERLQGDMKKLEESLVNLRKSTAPSLSDIFISIDEKDWKLSYLAEQVKKRQVTVAELQAKAQDVQRLEALIATSRLL